MTGLPTIKLSPVRRSMASRRGGSIRHPLWLVLAGLVLTGVLATSIQRANVITELREEIQVLRSECDEAEAGRALLSVRWNARSSRQIVMARARDELGLVCPDTPARLLVCSRESSLDERDDASLLMAGVVNLVSAAAADERP